ncbi:MAG: isochorismatase family protein [Gemmatimonadota bacterium]|jgi:nicotinamidase/pyrazinamidase
MTTRTALLIVDVQNDFCPGGALAVREGDRVVPVLNEYARRVHDAGGAIFASRDWHPTDTMHFQAQGGPWPPHCVQGTNGADFHPALELPGDAAIITKGDDRRDHGYSAFDGADPDGRRLAATLEADGVRRLLVGGLATDYCVLNTALDARRHGFDTVLLLDAIRGIDVKAGDVARALDAMMRAGVRTATLETLVAELT